MSRFKTYFYILNTLAFPFLFLFWFVVLDLEPDLGQLNPVQIRNIILISRMSCELGLDLLQSYLRELPSPLFGEGLYADWLEAGNLSVHAFHTLCRFSVHI
jgi:hypothetical protein